MKKAGIERLHPIESLGNVPAQQGEIRIERLESRLEPRVPFPHRHDFFHFIFLKQGSGWHEIDFTKFKAERGALFFVKPGQVHSWQLGKATRGYVLEFTAESLQKTPLTETLLRQLEGVPEKILLKDSSTTRPLLDLMFKEADRAEKNYRISLEHFLILFLLQVTGMSAEKPVTSAQKSLVDRFRAAVETHFRRHHAVEFYAKSLAVTPKRLTTQVARALGKSAGAVIQERILVEAKRMLAYSDLPVAEIGYELGYDDPNYFARFFRQRVGLSPGKFRERAAHSVPN